MQKSTPVGKKGETFSIRNTYTDRRDFPHEVIETLGGKKSSNSLLLD